MVKWFQNRIGFLSLSWDGSSFGWKESRAHSQATSLHQLNINNDNMPFSGKKGIRSHFSSQKAQNLSQDGEDERSLCNLS